MPTYEFRCPNGHDFEEFFLKISAAKSELACPQCGAIAPRRVSAGGGLAFKGSGFYITDYGKDGKKDQKKAASSESSGSSSSSPSSSPSSSSSSSAGSSSSSASSTSSPSSGSKSGSDK